MKVYLVHRGFAYDDSIKKGRPCGSVTYRLKKEDAEDIAKLLNEKLHEMRYFEYLASQTNEALGGDSKKILEADTPQNREKVANMREEAMKDKKQAAILNYGVTEMNIVGEDEKKLKEEIEQLSIKE